MCSKGSVRKSGRRVRITAQLMDALTGTHLWADRFDGSLEDRFVAAREFGERRALCTSPAGLGLLGLNLSLTD
jgi:TolB-like protein